MKTNALSPVSYEKIAAIYPELPSLTLKNFINLRTFGY